MRILKMMIWTTGLIGFSSVFAESPKQTKKVYRETQQVDFDGVDIDGVVRKPDGAYLNPKRGVEFIPLYEVKKQVGDSIRESVEYLR